MVSSNTWTFLLLASIFVCTSVEGLDCTSDKIKVYVKLSDPTQFDEPEQYLFRSLTAYSVRDYCNGSASCTPAEANTDVSDVVITKLSPRVSFCMEVTSADNNLVRSAINGSLERFYGGLQLSSEVLQIVGVDPIIEEDPEPDFPTWLIPFIVIAGLILLAALAMVYFGWKNSKKQPEGEEKESLTDAEAGAHHGVYADDEQRTEL